MQQVVHRGSVIAPATGFTKGCGFDFNLNPAIGCRFGCSYCYAANFTQDRAPAGAAWGEWTTLKAHSGDALASHASLTGKSIYMSTATDPYQPAERTAHVTRGILEALTLPRHRGVTLVVQTRAPLVTRDVDLLSDIHQHGLVQVNMSVTTDCDAIRKVFEPTCPPVDHRLRAVETLVQAGLQVAVTVTPMLPLRSVADFSATLAGLGLAAVVIQPFHEVQSRVGVRSTRSEALRLMEQHGVTLEQIRQQANRLYAALKGAGVPVGVNQSGFNVPTRH